MDSINKFICKINDLINEYNSDYVKRYNKNDENKLDLKNILYASLINLNSSGISYVASKLELDGIVKSVSKNAVIKKRVNPNTYLSVKCINDDLINFIYNSDDIINKYNFSINSDNKSYVRSKLPNKSLFINNTSNRFIAVDGCQYNVDSALINDSDIIASKRDDYGVCQIVVLYDVMNNIPINYSLAECTNLSKANETNGFLNQIDYLSANDICIFDRWYHSKNLVEVLNSREIDYIFRMKKSSILFKGMLYNQSKIIDYSNKRVQLYQIQN